MSGKIKKSSENMSFSLSRWFRRISNNALPISLITIIVITYSIFLFGGGLFTLINKPMTAYVGPGGSPIYFLYPDMSNQFVSDTIISAMLYTLGFVGLLAIYQSSKSVHKPRQAYMMLIVGVAFLLLSYIFLESSINFKLHPY